MQFVVAALQSMRVVELFKIYFYLCYDLLLSFVKKKMLSACMCEYH